MRHTPEDKNAPLSVAVFLAAGEYDQDDTALVSYNDLYDYVRNAQRVAVETANLKPETDGELEYTSAMFNAMRKTAEDSQAECNRLRGKLNNIEAWSQDALTEGFGGNADVGFEQINGEAKLDTPATIIGGVTASTEWAGYLQELDGTP
jgi:hypothetical protein